MSRHHDGKLEYRQVFFALGVLSISIILGLLDLTLWIIPPKRMYVHIHMLILEKNGPKTIDLEKGPFKFVRTIFDTNDRS